MDQFHNVSSRKKKGKKRSKSKIPKFLMGIGLLGVLVAVGYVIITALLPQSNGVFVSVIPTSTPFDIMGTNASRPTISVTSTNTLSAPVGGLHILKNTEVPHVVQNPTLTPIVAAMPAAQQQMPQSDRELFDNANGNLTAKGAFQYNLNADLSVTMGSESAGVSISGNGHLVNLNDITNLGLSLDSTIKLPTEDGQMVDILYNMRMLQGVLHFSAEVPQVRQGLKWISLSLSDALTIISGGMLGDIGNLDDLSNVIPAGLDISDLSDYEDLLALLDFNKFVTVTRLADTGTSANYRMDVDVKNFLQSEDFIAFFRSIVQLQDGVLDATQAEELTQLGIGLQAMIPIFLKRLDLTITERININEQNIEELRLNFTATIDSAILQGGMGGQPVTVSLDVLLTFSAHGIPHILESPASIPWTSFPDVPAQAVYSY